MIYYHMYIYFSFAIFGILMCAFILAMLILESFKMGFPPPKELVGISIVIFPVGIAIFKISYYFFKREIKKLDKYDNLRWFYSLVYLLKI